MIHNSYTYIYTNIVPHLNLRCEKIKVLFSVQKKNALHRLGVSRFLSCSQNFFLKRFSKADIYLDHIKAAPNVLGR